MDQSPKEQTTIGIVLEDGIHEAGRKIFRFQFGRMESHEPGVRLGMDIEELHDMRVAARRLRSAMSDFRPFFTKKVVKKFTKNLRTTGRILGQVRDLDVFLENALVDIDKQAEIDQNDLGPLIEYCIGLRETHRETMLNYLDSVEYSEFTKDFSDFIAHPTDANKVLEIENPEKLSLQSWIPQLYQKRLSKVKDFNQIVDTASLAQLHSLRINIKKLRYAIEFFREIFEEDAEKVILEMKVVQDHLGKLNDARMACELLDEYLRCPTGVQETEPDLKAKAYLLLKQYQRETLVSSFSLTWKAFLASGVESLVKRLAADTSRPI